MTPAQLRIACNWAIAWYRAVPWRCALKIAQAVRPAVPVLLLMSGWGFITWSMFLWNSRAWAASIGIFLILNALMPVIEAGVKARISTRTRRSE